MLDDLLRDATAIGIVRVIYKRAVYRIVQLSESADGAANQPERENRFRRIELLCPQQRIAQWLMAKVDYWLERFIAADLATSDGSEWDIVVDHLSDVRIKMHQFEILQDYDTRKIALES